MVWKQDLEKLVPPIRRFNNGESKLLEDLGGVLNKNFNFEEIKRNDVEYTTCPEMYLSKG